jgi:2-dehydro-3-deoxyphosphogluconate aldolase/(4S)-4-hydroxy-2-oxoglutarate aldolase
MSALEAITSSSMVAIIRSKSFEEANLAATVLCGAGVTSIEFTTTTPRVFDLIEEFSKIDGLNVGVGTAMSAEHVASAKSAGAKFVISPHTDPLVIKKTLELGLVSIPGVATPTDIASALSSGAHLLKLFPASHFGPSYLKAVRDPFPQASWLATGGVNLENLADWFEAGAIGFGLGGPLLGGGTGEIAPRVKAFIDAIKKVKIGKL